MRSLGGYTILDQLSVGGMGEVFVACKKGPLDFARLVALKTIRTDIGQTEKLRAMFQDEARLLSRLHHNAIAQIYDFGEDEQSARLFLAMEFVGGVSFLDLIELQLPASVAAAAIAEACHGLHAAHELRAVDGSPLGVVHRDVSPENLMLTYGGSVKVLDFGIALMKGRVQPVTEFGAIKGKPPYLSPEQISNKAVDRRSDVFSISAVLYELLTGQRAFQGNDLVATITSVLTAAVVPPDKLTKLPSGLSSIVMRGLASDPADRWQNARELALALKEVASREGDADLVAFVETSLRDRKAQHEDYLANLLKTAHTAGDDTTSANARPGRPSGVQTTLAQGPTDLDVTAPVDGRKRGIWLAALVGLVAAAALVLYITSRKEPGEPTAVADAATSVAMNADANTSSSASLVVSSRVSATSDSSRSIVRSSLRSRSSRSRRDSSSTSSKGRIVSSRSVATQQYGFVTFGATPYARIQLDNRSLGSTPKFRVRVAVGTHRVKLIDPETGKIRSQRTIDVREGKLTKVIIKE